MTRFSLTYTADDGTYRHHLPDATWDHVATVVLNVFGTRIAGAGDFRLMCEGRWFEVRVSADKQFPVARPAESVIV